MPNNRDKSVPASTSLTPVQVLVADDAPASCRFLCDALSTLGAQVETCGDGPSALASARNKCFDLLLLDCRMPGAGALEVLAALRNDSLAASFDAIAVATTAELGPGDRTALMAAGFSDILLKPCSVADLQRKLTLVQPDRHSDGVLDDQAALASSGDTTTMHALRQLLRDELVAIDQELEPGGSHPAGFGDRLHRLRSSCGFCGANALSAHTILLQQQMASQGATTTALARFRKTLRATMAALDR